MTTAQRILMRARRGMRLTAGAGVLLAASACQSILDVKNPNNIPESSLDNPAAATAEANGLLASTTQMLGATTVVYADATDEMDWIGSRDAWGELDQGIIGDFVNEFSNGAFPIVAQARYLSDKTIERLEGFDKDGTLKSKSDLMRSYLYGAVVYASIADMYDDFAFSNKTIPAAPIGRAAMGTLYDKAVGWLDKALALATTNADKYNILAWRARVKHGKAVWSKVTPKGSAAPANPLVNDAGAVADANAALAVGSDASEFSLVNNVEATAGINVWFEVNGRNESSPGKAYVVDPTNTANKYVAALKDPISNTADARLQARLTAFKNFGTTSGTLWITNSRELRLILAEAALAAGNTAEFTNQINIVRAQDGKPAFSGQISNLAMLTYERQVELWLMRRRLMDMYRFGIKDTKWAASANYDSAFNQVGLLFPIAYVERISNPCVTDATACSK
ncbi:MAG TPA: RagB/SusD family nutrient uptake outer membrane protein [Gemmatimonadaceae bacterium]|nr:RagB/SusD family nutrient uptake outer membrane protein [Gemmatimonadaceae bacterium]